MLLGGVGALLALEPFTEIFIIRALNPRIPGALPVVAGIALVALAVRT